MTREEARKAEEDHMIVKLLQVRLGANWGAGGHRVRGVRCRRAHSAGCRGWGAGPRADHSHLAPKCCHVGWTGRDQALPHGEAAYRTWHAACCSGTFTLIRIPRAYCEETGGALGDKKEG